MDDLKPIARKIHQKIKGDMQEESALIIHLFKWLALASLVGALTGFIASLFLISLSFASESANIEKNYFFLLPAALVLNVLFIRFVFPRSDGPSTDAVISHIHKREEISPASIVKAFFAPIITIAGGGSAGKEAPAADMGAASGNLIARFLKFNDEDKRKLSVCGISAGFAAVFGTPIAGAIFGIEVLFVGSILYEVMLPAFVAGIIGYAVAAWMGVPFWYHAINISPEFSTNIFFNVILASVFFGLCSFAMIEVMKLSKKIIPKSLKLKILSAFFGGIALAVLAFVFSTDYLGLGIDFAESAVQGEPAHLGAFLLKMIFTGLTFGFGGSGGLVTPTIFVGSSAGNSFAQLFNLDLGVFAALGSVAVLAGAMNTPIAASILAIELFGPGIAPYAAIACIISFSISGHRSVYPSQIYNIVKAPAEKFKISEYLEGVSDFKKRSGWFWFKRQSDKGKKPIDKIKK